MTETPLHTALTDYSSRLHDALEQNRMASNAPDDTKTSRRYSAGEVAQFLNVSIDYIRKAHHNKRIPEVAVRSNGARLYSLPEMREIRRILASKSRSPEKFLPGRQTKEHRRLQVISMSTFKGGSGKTTSSSLLGQWLALRGYRVLMIDADPQASLTTLFGGPNAVFDEGGTLYEAIKYSTSSGGPVPLADLIQPTYFTGIDIVPGGITLSGFEQEAPNGGEPPFYSKIGMAIRSVEAAYDVVIIDCPPQLGYTTLSALAASTSIIMPVTPSHLDVASTAQFMEMAGLMLEAISEQTGEPQEFDHFKFLVTRMDTNETGHKHMLEALRALFPTEVLENVILKSSAVTEAGMKQRTVYDARRSEMTGRTLDRILDSVNAVGKEVEDLLIQTWEAQDG